MPDVIRIPKKKTGTKGGRMGDKTNSVYETNEGLVNLEDRIADLDSSGGTIRSTRNLIFNG